MYLRLPKAQRNGAARLDLNYYLPCRVANREGGGARTVAVIGLGRTDDGDFLSSEDMELLESLAGYIGIAIQNAQLYQRLEQKFSEFESLKEFHENIVESINIGVFAVDLDDRIESWNTQMETMYERGRAEVLHQSISAVCRRTLSRDSTACARSMVLTRSISSGSRCPTGASASPISPLLRWSRATSSP